MAGWWGQPYMQYAFDVLLIAPMSQLWLDLSRESVLLITTSSSPYSEYSFYTATSITLNSL
jgi:hypothetical protein